MVNNEILLEEIKRNLKKYYDETNAKLLHHDSKIAEMYNYLKTNLSDSVQEQLDSMKVSGELEDIIESVVNEFLDDTIENFMLSCFFDENNSNKINFYVTRDGINFNKLNIANEISGRDPSLAYYGGKFFVAVTDYDSTHDFSIYESTDLENWTKHEINVGFYNANSNYNKVWAPHLFFEDGKLFVHIAKQYGSDEAQGGEGWGIFKIYRIKCINIDTLTFDNPEEVTLSNSTNYIDSKIFKYNNTYYMVVKDDRPTRRMLDVYSSADLKNWNLVNGLNWNDDEYLEGASIIEFNGNNYLLADRYVFPSQSQIVSKSDTLAFKKFKEINKVGNEDCSHGSMIACYNKEVKQLISEIEGYCFNENSSQIEDIKKPRIAYIGSELGGHLNKYVKLFTVKFGSRYKVARVLFRLSDSQSNKFDNIYNLDLRMGDTDTLLSNSFKNLSNSSNKLNDDLYCIKTGTNEWSVYLKATMTNISPCLEILSYTKFNETITLGSNKPIDSITTTNAIKPVVHNDFLSVGIPIESVNLDDIKSVGVYVSMNTTITSGITNKPTNVVGGFRLEVFTTQGTIKFQRLYENNDNLNIFYRYCDEYGTWHDWKQVAFVEDVETMITNATT